MSTAIQKGSVGVRIQITITKSGAQWNLTGATVTFLFQKPSGSYVAKAATAEDADKGVYSYVSDSASVFDETGEWKVHPKVAVGSSVYYGGVVRFPVMVNLES